MALPRLAPLDGLEARLGKSLGGDDARRAEAMLDDASALIRAEAGLDWLDEDGHLSDDVPEIIQSICLAAAYRGFQNPQGAAQSSVGDVSLSYGNTPPGAIWLTPAELRQVRRIGGGSQLQSIPIESPWALSDTSAYFVPVDGGGDPINMGPPPWEVQ